ncbi:MAG: hypothetical protein K2Y51_22210 [Gammaproteobacteria bacterium]|nr:hypothetical protein [Gammaproteobacteria bacterium]
MSTPVTAIGRLLKGLRGKKGTAPPQTPPPNGGYVAPTDPMKATALLTRLRDLGQDATDWKITLGGNLAARRKAVTDAVNRDDYVTAGTLLDDLARDQGQELDDRKQTARSQFVALKDRLDAGLKVESSDPPGLAALQGTLKQACDGHANGLKGVVVDLAALLDPVNKALAAVEQGRAQDAKTKQDAQAAYRKDVEPRVAGALAPRPGYPEAVAQAQGTLKSAVDDYTSKVAGSHAQQAVALIAAVTSGLEGVDRAIAVAGDQLWQPVAARFDAAKQRLDKLRTWSDVDAAKVGEQHDAILELRRTGDHLGAVKKVDDFEAAAGDRYEDKVKWYDGAKPLRDDIAKRLATLEKIDKPCCDALTDARGGCDKHAENRDYAKALSEITDLKGKVAKAAAALATHHARVVELAPEIEQAKTALAVTSVSFGTKKTAYEKARSDMDAARTVDRYGELPALLADFQAKLADVLDHYRDSGSGPAHAQWLKEKYAQVKLLGQSNFYKAMTVKLKTPGLKEKLDAFETAANDAGLWDPEPTNPTKADVKKWDDANKLADVLFKARESVDKAESQLHKQYKKQEAELLEAEKVAKAKTDPVPDADKQFLAALKAFRDLRDKDKKFGDAHAKLPDLGLKARAVLQPLITAAKQKVQTVSTAPQNQRTGLAKTAIMSDLSAYQLAALSPEEQIALMEALRTNGDVASGTDSTARTEAREAQVTLYNAMKLDEQFQSEDAKKRQVMTAKLLEEQREMLLKAKVDWKRKPTSPQEAQAFLEDKRKTLEAVVKAQCEAFGFPLPVLPIEFVDEPEVLDNGAFDPTTRKISLNKNSVALNDFQSALDLVIHENHHNHQDDLVKRLSLPDNDTKKIKPGDPLYTQARLFALNDASGGYVPSGEGQDAYMKQPLEEHSWSAGPKTARELVQGLARV